ncbi:hypothetical protein Q3G72_003036 [Acer saccharum]|nr:hypothetical protein Q3G72_003036 [Acer saccharum]
MVKEAARKCCLCGHYGHNSRTCNGGKSFKLFGVNIENSRKVSMSMENMQSVVDVHVDAWSPSDGKRDKAVHAYFFSSGVGDWRFLQLILDIRSMLCRLGQALVEFDSRDTNVFADALAKRGAEGGGIAWTEKEHIDFLAGLNMLGKGDWKGISRYFVRTRSPSQVASHAQKFFLRPASPHNKKRRASLFDMQYQQSASRCLSCAAAGPIPSLVPSLVPSPSTVIDLCFLGRFLCFRDGHFGRCFVPPSTSPKEVDPPPALEEARCLLISRFYGAAFDF